jgi:hypothetical protein
MTKFINLKEIYGKNFEVLKKRMDKYGTTLDSIDVIKEERVNFLGDPDVVYRIVPKTVFKKAAKEFYIKGNFFIDKDDFLNNFSNGMCDGLEQYISNDRPSKSIKDIINYSEKRINVPGLVKYGSPVKF